MNVMVARKRVSCSETPYACAAMQVQEVHFSKPLSGLNVNLVLFLQLECDIAVHLASVRGPNVSFALTLDSRCFLARIISVFQRGQY